MSESKRVKEVALLQELLKGVVVEEHPGEGKKRKSTSSERLGEGLSKKVKG